jgi:predicted HicB family RNase H-like nuclease
MTKLGDEPIAQLATRIPKRLHHAVKVYCVSVGMSVMEFVIQALEEKLARHMRRGARRRG